MEPETLSERFGCLKKRHTNPIYFDSVKQCDRNGEHSFKNTSTHLGDINLSPEVKHTLANGLSNVAFYPEQSSLQLLISGSEMIITCQMQNIYRNCNLETNSHVP